MSSVGRHGVDLLWIPLGAGGWFVRWNGRVWERMQAIRTKRDPQDLYHSALIVDLPEGRYVVENAWPIPDAEGASRGVVAEGPVFTRWLGRFRTFRYEVRCWPAGIIADASWSPCGPIRVADGEPSARRVVEAPSTIPPLVWGRRIHAADDMWNSNSTIAWVLTRAGIDAASLAPPPGGRAPGWNAGVQMARAAGELRPR